MPTVGGDEKQVFFDGQIESKSSFAKLEKIYSEVLQQNRTLRARLEEIKLREKNLPIARQLAQLEKELVRRGIIRDRQRYYPKKSLIGSRKHGVDWQEGAAEALSASEAQGKFGSLQDVYFAVQKGAELGLAKAAVFPLPPDASSIVYVPEKRRHHSGNIKEDAPAWPAKYVYVEVFPNGKVIGRPSLTSREPVPPRQYVEKPHPLETALEYNRTLACGRIIVAQSDDVAKIAATMRVSEDLVAGVKDHLFVSKHVVQLGPNREVEAFFTPINEIADLWRKATDRTLSTAEEAEFKRLLAHEYVERGLMTAGIPYHSRNKNAWIEDEEGDFRPLATKGHYGAHALAPHPNSQLKPFALWEKRLGLSADGLTLADDLSNLDEVIKDRTVRPFFFLSF
ncbi:MAG: hypothetical protein ACPGWR_01040 [Ardenticatenaceae bacterium]